MDSSGPFFQCREILAYERHVDEQKAKKAFCGGSWRGVCRWGVVAPLVTRTSTRCPTSTTPLAVPTSLSPNCKAAPHSSRCSGRTTWAGFDSNVIPESLASRGCPPTVFAHSCLAPGRILPACFRRYQTAALSSLWRAQAAALALGSLRSQTPHHPPGTYTSFFFHTFLFLPSPFSTFDHPFRCANLRCLRSTDQLSGTNLPTPLPEATYPCQLFTLRATGLLA